MDRACRAVVDRNHVENSVFASTEATYWLLLHAQLGRRYLLSPARLSEYAKRSGVSGSEYSTIATVLLYAEDRVRYAELKKHLIDDVPNILSRMHPLAADTLMLKVDLLSCPYIDEADKSAWMSDWFSGATPGAIQKALECWPASVFAEWKDFDLSLALRAKQGRQVY